jgi:hypothetical protein
LGNVVVPCASAGEPVWGAACGFAALPVEGVGFVCGICIPSISAGVACGEGDGDGDGIGICIDDGLGVGEGLGEGFGVGDGAGIRIPGIDCLSRSCAPDCVAKRLAASSAMAAQRVKSFFTT